ncbi:cytochrome C [Rhodobacter capsulatus]|nr:cytochrome C [Rhodobacter capsulatus]KQB12116.1 cytochrome C [Rhodobacter capsulatus]
MSLTAATLAALVLAAPAFAGDAAKGEKEFNKCKTCHSIIAPDGTEIVKGAKTGPNLYGVVGRTAGTYPEFKYKDSIVALGASGFAWTEEDIATYVKDPGAFLKEKTDDKKAKSGMAFKLAKGGEDVAAYLASVVK